MVPLCRLVAFSVASPVSPLSVSLASLIQIQLRLQIWSHRQIPIVIQVHFQVQIQVQIQINFRIHVQIQILAQMQVQIQFQVGIQLRTQMQMWFTFSFTFLSGFRFTFSWSCRRQLVQVVCRDLPNGGLGGTLLQRHVCPALAKVRAWIADHLIRNGHNLSSRAFLALARGLAHSCPSQQEQLQLRYFRVAQAVPFDPCWLSGFHCGRFPRPCQSLGWAFVVITRDGELVAAAYGAPPKWADTAQVAGSWVCKWRCSTCTFLRGCALIVIQCVWERNAR